jgi:hypothetical protein
MLACLAIPRSTRTAPTAATGALLGLLPIHVMIEAEVQAGMYIIRRRQQCKLNLTNFGHARQSRELEHEPILQMGTDRFVPKYAYHKPITVKFLDKCEWQNGFKVDIKGGSGLVHGRVRGQ